MVCGAVGFAEGGVGTGDQGAEDGGVDFAALADGLPDMVCIVGPEDPVQIVDREEAVLKVSEPAAGDGFVGDLSEMNGLGEPGEFLEKSGVILVLVCIEGPGAAAVEAPLDDWLEAGEEVCAGVDVRAPGRFPMGIDLGSSGFLDVCHPALAPQDVSCNSIHCLTFFSNKDVKVGGEILASDIGFEAVESTVFREGVVLEGLVVEVQIVPGDAFGTVSDKPVGDLHGPGNLPLAAAGDELVF